MSARLYTTQQAADAVGITRVTLQAWIAAAKIKAPKPRLRGARGLRLWTESDISRLRAAKKKIYGKGPRGRPRKKE